MKKKQTIFFPGEDGRICDFTAVNNDHFWTGKIYYTLIINNDLVKNYMHMYVLPILTL